MAIAVRSETFGRLCRTSGACGLALADSSGEGLVTLLSMAGSIGFSLWACAAGTWPGALLQPLHEFVAHDRIVLRHLQDGLEFADRQALVGNCLDDGAVGLANQPILVGVRRGG